MMHPESLNSGNGGVIERAGVMKLNDRNNPQRATWRRSYRVLDLCTEEFEFIVFNNRLAQLGEEYLLSI